MKVFAESSVARSVFDPFLGFPFCPSVRVGCIAHCSTSQVKILTVESRPHICTVLPWTFEVSLVLSLRPMGSEETAPDIPMEPVVASAATVPSAESEPSPCPSPSSASPSHTEPVEASKPIPKSAATVVKTKPIPRDKLAAFEKDKDKRPVELHVSFYTLRVNTI